MPKVKTFSRQNVTPFPNWVPIMLCYVRQNKQNERINAQGKTKQRISKNAQNRKIVKFQIVIFKMLTSQNNIDNTIKKSKERINQKQGTKQHKIKSKHKITTYIVNISIMNIIDSYPIHHPTDVYSI